MTTGSVSSGVVVELPARTGELVLSGGRRLGWSEWGRPEARPVLLCPGAATSRSLGMSTSAVQALDVRLISADRPGLGVSDGLPDRSLAAWAADAAALLGARGASGAPVVGFSQGAPFALACAAAGVVSAVAVVSGADELAHPAFADRLPDQLRSMVAAALSDPQAAEVAFASITATSMWELVIDASDPRDREVYTEPRFAALYHRALDEAFAQGPAGYARDTLLAMRPWPFEPRDIEVPVHLWYGAHDTSLMHSPDHGATLATRLPTAQRHVLTHAGGALLWTDGTEVLRNLLNPR